MIKKANYNLKLSLTELRQLVELKKSNKNVSWEGENWEVPPDDNIKGITDKIRRQLEFSQAICSYCGLKLWGTSGGEVEHIAPKASYRYPMFTFTLKNLTFACHLCNSSKKKGLKDTILTFKRVYSKCEFSIVHPYFDEPDEHYDWTDEQVALLIQVKNNSNKAKKSIEIFDLASPKMNEFRAQQIMFDKFKAEKTLSATDESLLKNATEKVDNTTSDSI